MRRPSRLPTLAPGVITGGRTPLRRRARAALATLARPFTFVVVFAQYARHHPARYAARIAYGIAFQGLPF